MDETKSLATTRQVAYVIKDVIFDEPFEVYEGTEAAWWMDGGVKLHKLIDGFKGDLLVKEACILAGISDEQYQYFCDIHPKFYGVKERCKSVLPIIAKQGLVEDVKNNWKVRTWYLEKKQPELYGRELGGARTLKPLNSGESIATMIQEAFMDKNGNLIQKRETLTIHKHDQPTTEPADDNGGGDDDGLQEQV